jgi:hypothetical protein
MKQYRYILDSSSKKLPCPKCEKIRLVRYIDTQTKAYLSGEIGRCDREISCGYHLKPSDAGITNVFASISTESERKPLKPSLIPSDYFNGTQGKYERNQLHKYLKSLPGWTDEIATRALMRYRVGTGAANTAVADWAIFWLIDENDNVRSGKLIKYDTVTGKRLKSGYSYDWIHTLLARNGKLERDTFELVQCFYGAHLIDSGKPVAIVESEKTAIIAAEYFPNFTWVASGMLRGINDYKMRSVAGLTVVLFPDVGCYQDWLEYGDRFGNMASITVSDLLETHASEQEKGFDLADYLGTFDLSTFTEQISSANIYNFTKREAPNGFNPWTGEIFDSKGYPAEWN